VIHSTRRPKRLLAGVAALVATGIALAGCAASPSSSSVKQVLTVASTLAAFTSLDSGAITSGGYEEQRLLGNTIYEGLTRKDVSDPTAPATDAPALASSWDVAKDGLTYTFHLRENVTFQDGTPWNADAAIYNLTRYTDPKDPNYDATVSATYGVLTTKVKSFEKVDDMTIAFHMAAPYPYFIGDLYPIYFASPTSLEKSGSAGQAKNPVGTGPFEFVSQNGNQEVDLKKNPNYWGGAPKLDELHIVNIPDASSRVAALRSGRVDWIEGASPDDIPSLESSNFVITKQLFDWTWNWSFMTNKGPLANPEVRLALNYAIDRDAIANDLLDGTAVAMTNILPSKDPMYESSDDLYTYDVDKAKQMLADAGYANGFTMTVSYPASGSGYMLPKPMNEALQAQLAKVGVTVKFIVEDFPTWIAKINAKTVDSDARMAAGTMDLYSTWGTYNFGCGTSRYGYCNEDVQKLLDTASTTIDDTARADLLKQAAKILTTDAPRLSVVSDTAPRAMTSHVKGFVQPASWWVSFNNIYMG
jgi:peptide/nickel transport system substrate-binding protein